MQLSQLYLLVSILHVSMTNISRVTIPLKISFMEKASK